MEQMSIPGVPVLPGDVYVALHYDWRSGWALRVSTPANEHSHGRQADYVGLSGGEATDVVVAELERLLGTSHELP